MTYAPARRGYSVKLLHLDCRTFAVKELLATRQAQAFGLSTNAIYLNTSDGQRTLDVGSGTISPLPTTIRLLAKHGDDWLVESGGVLAKFDASKQVIAQQYDAIKVQGKRQHHEHVDWDGGRFAVSASRYVDDAGEQVHVLDFGRPGIVYRELRIWNLQKGTERKLLVRLQAVGGSGEGVIPSEAHTELRGAKFRYTERIDPGVGADLTAFDWEEHTEWVTIEIATGKELLREPYSRSPVAAVLPGVGARVPAYLQQLFEQSPIRGWGSEQDLAHAFLEHVGLQPKLATSGVIKFAAVCRSADGEQLLVLNAGHFYHCDLKTKAVKQWVAPEALGKANVVLHAVQLQ